MDAPDTEEGRSHLLDLLADPDNLSDSYPFYGDNLVQVVVEECERLREARAIPILERIVEEFRGEEQVRERVLDSVRDAIARIEKAVREAPSE